MKYPKLRELVEAIRALVKGPYTSGFPSKPHVPEKNFRGKPEYNDDKCVGCNACSQVCPTGCIETKDIADAEVPVRKLLLHFDSCIFCGQCQEACITKEGIKLSNKFDMALFDRNEAVESVEKELLLCEGCRCIIGAKEHLIWLARKLGHLAYSNPTLYMVLLKDLKLAYPDIERSEEITRQDRIRFLCPKCRREITLNT